MLKMYHERSQRGDSPELWEENWRHDEFEGALRFCENDPLRPLFDRYATSGKKMLEGGCGQGQYVTFYSAKGVRVVGTDFACETLARLHARQNSLLLCASDVAALPYCDGAFDLYYSGGVVEHFEGGPGPALEEAWRVLRPGGTLLISVPYLSPLRRLLAPFKQGYWKRVAREDLDEHESTADKRFFQYVYSPREFESWLTKIGFRVIKRQGYAVLWGLSELPLFQRFLGGSSDCPTGNPDNGASNQSAEPVAGRGQDHSDSMSLGKRLLVKEDDTVPIAGVGIRVLRWACANMMMYVCIRSENLPARDDN